MAWGYPPLIQDLRTAQPGVTQPWYADESGAGRTFNGIRWHLDSLMIRGPLQGYFMDPTKRILVVYPWKVPRVKAFFRGYSLKILTGSRYLGGFMVTEAAQPRWLEERVEGGEILCGHHGRGGVQLTADRLCETVEIPPTRVGFCASHQPGHRDIITARGGRVAGGIPPGPL